MHIRTLAAALTVAVAVTLPLAGVAAGAAADRDCPDFSSQAEAQAALDARTGDPERLDRDKDGIACEDEFGEPTSTPTSTPAPTTSDKPESQVRDVPRGGVETGDGSAASVSG